MIDYEMILAEKQAFTAAVTTKAVDLGQKTPNIGLLNRPLYFVFTPSVTPAGSGSVTFTLEDSADGTTFAAVAAYGPIAVSGINRDIAFPFPVHHRQYVRVKTAITGTVTALSGTLAVADGFSDPAGYWRDEVEFYKPDPDAAKVNLQTQVTGVLPVANGGTGKNTAV